MVSLYLSTFDLGFLALFPAFLGISGLVMQIYTEKRIAYVKTSLSSIILYTMIAFGGLMVASLLAKNNPWVLTQGSIFSASLSKMAVIDQQLFGVLMAISEEQFFRGFITSYFVDRTNPFIGCAGSSGVFAVFHFAVYGTSPTALTFIFMSGLILSFVAYKTGLISPTMIAHIINNLVAI
jgi:membrane protease YdiL (CAAX protease family)